jgi:hypothetical protein
MTQTTGGLTALLGAERVPPRMRLALSVALGLLAAAITARKSALVPGPRDFGQVWFMARSILHGANPYPLVGPGLAFDWPWPLVYPLTAGMVAIPFAAFPEPVASALFVGIGGAAFAWALMQYGYGPLFGFFSLSVREACEAGQWSLLIASAFAIAPLSMFLVAKPTIGVAVFFARPTRRAIVGGILIFLTAFLVQPTWIAEWMHAVQRYAAMGRTPVGEATNRPFRALLSFPGGFIVLLCFLRWRRPEARLVAALVCVPITVYAYETVPLFLVPRTFRQAALLLALSYAQYFLTAVLAPVPSSFSALQEITGRMLVFGLYVPATMMILLRPNEGPLPAWIEDRIASWPAHLRGGSTARV